MPKNVMQHILAHGSCEKYAPEGECEPTDLQPGKDRLDVLAERVQAGQPLWHDEDRDCLDNR